LKPELIKKIKKKQRPSGKYGKNKKKNNERGDVMVALG